MAKQVFHKIKDKVEEFFPLKPFLLSFSLLLLTLICFIGIQTILNGDNQTDIKLTGKIIAEIKVEENKEEIVPSIIQPNDIPEQSEPESVPNLNDQPVSEKVEIEIEESIAGLSEETPLGSLPIIRAADGLTSFKAYQVPFTVKSTTKGVISLVMTDFGLSASLSQSMIETLPTMVTFIASPYANDLQPTVLSARSKNFEIWMDIPMEGSDIDIAPNSILAGLNNKENLFRLNTHLSKAKGYAGIVINAEAKFPDGSSELQTLTNSISARGLGIAQLNPSDKVIGPSALKANAPFVQSKIWIDETLSKESLLKSLENAEKLSLEHGVIVAAFRPSAFTASIIQGWQKSLESKNIQLAPLSYSAKMNFSAPSSTVKKDVPN